MNAFTNIDCWVLFSIGFSNRGSRLRDIISTCDVLNHAIITREELENGLSKLIGNGYVVSLKDRFYATDKAKNFYNENSKFAEGCIAEWIRIAEIFKKQPVQENESSIIKITDEEYKKAVRRYSLFF